MTLDRAFLRDAVGPATIALVATSSCAAVLSGLRLLHEAGVVDFATWCWAVLLAIPASASIAVPVAGAVGAVAALSRWVGEGAWAGARAAGVAGARLLGPALALGLVGGITTAAFTGWIEPAVRRTAHVTLAEAASRTRLWPGVATEIGPVVVLPDRVATGVAHDAFLGAPGALGTARRVRVVAASDGPALELSDGVLVITGDPAATLRFTRWTRPLPARSPRLELAERTSADLLEVVRRTEADGRDASYERAVLHKRWLHPLATLLLPLALLPLGAGRRPAAGLGLAALGYLVSVRAGDHLAAAVGGLAAASTGPLFVVAVGMVAWARWDDR